MILDYWAFRAGIDPIPKLLRDGWRPEEIVLRLCHSYLDHKAEARGVRELERTHANNKVKNLLKPGR